MNVTVIGLGLIGGSAAIDLKKRNFADTVYGVDNNILHAETAKNIGIIDEICSLEEGVEKADLIILATPVDTTLVLIKQVLDLVVKQIVTDVCSTKHSIAEVIKNHPKRPNYVASHPMAGTEKSGPWAAFSGMFDGKAAILCDTDESSARAIEVVRSMWDALNMRQVLMDSKSHDMHAAYVSHISQIASYALALTVLDKEKDEKHIFDLASGGFDSTARLAKSSAAMWTPIFLHNKENVIHVIDTFVQKINKLKEFIINKDTKSIDDYIFESNRIKRILNK